MRMPHGAARCLGVLPVPNAHMNLKFSPSFRSKLPMLQRHNDISIGGGIARRLLNDHLPHAT
jgi:hypothetical protein